MIPMIAAAAIAAAVTSPLPKKRLRMHAPIRRSAAAKAARAAREERLVILALRHALLHDFLVETVTETCVLRDSTIVAAGNAMSIGPTIVDVDFIGNPIVRTRVRNGSNHTVDLLVTVVLHEGGERHAEASTVVEHLAPHETRTVELLCPALLRPKSATWSVTLL